VCLSRVLGESAIRFLWDEGKWRSHPRQLVLVVYLSLLYILDQRNAATLLAALETLARGDFDCSDADERDAEDPGTGRIPNSA